MCHSECMANDQVEAAPTGRSARPGGRSARVRTAVHRAVTELLAEGPAEALTIPQIAASAGVHATTLYRRWPSLADLLAEVAASRFTGDLVVPDTGSLEGDLSRWACDVATDLADPDSSALIRAAVGSGPEGSAACSADRRAQLQAILERETNRGGTAPSVETAADLILGPLYYRAIFLGEPADVDRAAALVGIVLAEQAHTGRASCRTAL